MSVETANWPSLNVNDIPVIVHRNFEGQAYLLIEGLTDANVTIQTWNSVDDLDFEVLTPPTPVGAVTHTIVSGGEIQVPLPVGAAISQDRVTRVLINSGRVRIDAVSPSPFYSYLEQPSSPPRHDLDYV